MRLYNILLYDLKIYYSPRRNILVMPKCSYSWIAFAFFLKQTLFILKRYNNWIISETWNDRNALRHLLETLISLARFRTKHHFFDCRGIRFYFQNIYSVFCCKCSKYLKSNSNNNTYSRTLSCKKCKNPRKWKRIQKFKMPTPLTFHNVPVQSALGGFALDSSWFGVPCKSLSVP